MLPKHVSRFAVAKLNYSALACQFETRKTTQVLKEGNDELSNIFMFYLNKVVLNRYISN